MRKEDLMTPVAEAYRRLQTNLMFNANQNVFVITSAGPEEGKSVTAANLAATMANDGVHVLLIDADLRRPRQHQIFSLDNEVGLSTLLIAHHDQERPTVTNLNQCIQVTAIPHLKVITSGFLPSNPTQVLRSPLMKRWIDAFRASKDIDIIIIDTPPVLLFGDSAVIASVAEADAVMVVNAQRTRGRAAQETKAQLGQVGVEIKGLVLNRVNPRDEAGNYGYGYGYGYYYADDRNKPRRSFFPQRRQNGAKNGANGAAPGTK
jgi:receptor protein-tyrosine kinase